MAQLSARACEQLESLEELVSLIQVHAQAQHDQRNAGQTVDIAAAGAYFRGKLQVTCGTAAERLGRGLCDTRKLLSCCMIFMLGMPQKIYCAVRAGYGRRVREHAGQCGAVQCTWPKPARSQ